MSTFKEALTTGKVVVRRAWTNTKNPEQVAVQFFQQIDSPNSVNTLVSMAQGIQPVQTVSAIFSFAKDVAQSKLGNTDVDFTTGGEAVYAADMFDQEVSIQVTENFTANPYSVSHQPKINPGSGEVVTGFDSSTGTNMPVYRHTELVPGGANHTWAAKASMGAKSVNEPGVNLSDLLTR
tara:strand:- start:822 stop:1358 length:537 start_codon:yes stop_codon:yes gene_type:complete